MEKRIGSVTEQPEELLQVGCDCLSQSLHLNVHNEDLVLKQSSPSYTVMQKSDRIIEDYSKANTVQ